MSDALTPAEAAEYCNKKLGTFNQYRYTGCGPVYYRTSPDKFARIFYLREDLDKWLAGTPHRNRTFDIKTAIRVEPNCE